MIRFVSKNLFCSKPQINSNIRDLLTLLKPEKNMVFLGMASAFISSSLLLYYPALATDVEVLRNLKYDIANSDLSNQIYYSYYMKWMGIATVTGLVGGSRRYFNQQVSNRVAMRMRNVMFQKMLRDKEAIGMHSQQMIHKLSNDVSLVSSGLSLDILAFVRGLVFTIGGTGYLLYHAYPLLPISIGLMATFGWSAKFFSKYMAKAKMAETHALEHLSKMGQERLVASRLIRVSNMEEQEIVRYTAQICRWFKEAKVFSIHQALNMALLEAGGLAALIIILFRGCYLISIGQLDPELLRYGVNALLMAGGMRTMINIYNEIVKTAAIYRTITHFYPNLHNDDKYTDKEFVKNYLEAIKEDDDLIKQLQEPPSNSNVVYDRHHQSPPSVEFKGVSFSYIKGGQKILNKFSMHIKPGNIVALVGQSGSGKTTILNLLTKLQNIDEGEILIDGESLSKKDFSWVQRYISYVQQDGIIFNASVYENIIYGNQGFDQSLESVIEAAKQARAHDFITQMPDGYLTQLKSDGSTSLSGGQKQRIVLARAILKHPKILILDEATSNIDHQAENEIILALKEICKEKTVFLVSHKLENFNQFMNKLLIANRGEIACRVMRTAKKMGIQTVAVYSDIDKNTLFVEMADEAYHIGAAPAMSSYLKSDKIIDIALSTKCQAIHPGFGFLSENAQFSQDCENQGIVFVGPPAEAIRKMGSKSESKIIMTNAQVPVVPGYHGEEQDSQYLLEKAQAIQFPVLIKAVMGGGGKGMRIVWNKDQFKEALESAKREALKSFKDDRVLVEKYIEKPRHIEVQIFGDKHGNYVHLFERDCSIQRRHQKVIEEAPSALTELIRQDIGEKAKAAAKAVDYTNAGTVEFIFDLNSQQFYFMEMNTRLQVEHPITEMITGVDLVEWQLRVANGERLPLKQEDIKLKGHSIEARIYSESPQNNFLPGSGTLHYYREPKDVRIESGVRENDSISIYYDPMIAKLVAFGENRDLAIRKLDDALQQYKISGLPNNIDFLKAVLRHPEYKGWDYDTSFIEKHKDELLKQKQEFQIIDLAVGIVGRHVMQQKTCIPASLQNFWNNKGYTQTQDITLNSSCYAKEQSFKVQHSINNNVHTIQYQNQTITITQIEANQDDLFTFYTTEGIISRTICDRNGLLVFDAEGDPISFTFESEQINKGDHQERHHSDPKEITAPMPCTLTKVNVKLGQKVKKGEVILITEAMKMEHTIRAAIDGEIKEIRFKEGQFVDPGALIVRIE